MPDAMACAAFACHAGDTSSARVGGVAHVAAFDEDLGDRREVEAGQVVASARCPSVPS